MTVSHLASVDDYTDTVATVYNSAYGYAIGIASLEGVYEDGCTVNSEASLTRRTGMTLAFSASVSAAQTQSAHSNAASFTAASFAGHISSASTAQGASVPLPLASDISGVSYTRIVDRTNSDDDESWYSDETSIALIGAAGGVVVLAAVLGLAVWHFKGSQSESANNKGSSFKGSQSVEEPKELPVGIQTEAVEIELESPRSPGEVEVSGEAADLSLQFNIHSNPTVEATEPNVYSGFYSLGDPKATKPEDGDQTESSSPVGAAIRAAIRADSVPTMGNHNGHPKHNWRDGRKGMIPSG